MRFDGHAADAGRAAPPPRRPAGPRAPLSPTGAPGLPAARRWVDDLGFDIANHVHAVALPAPGGPGELRDLAGVLLSRPLDPAPAVAH